METPTNRIPEPRFDFQLAQDCTDWFANRSRDWLPLDYVPGTCFVCDEPCDLRHPGTTVAYGPAWPNQRGVPMEVHIHCIDVTPLKGRFIYSVLRRILAEIAMQTAWPGARRFDPPQGY